MSVSALPFLLLLGAFLLGSIPSGYLITRVWKGVDVRTVGSGNIGFTNVVRAAGWAPGLLTLLLDFFKGFFPVWLASRWNPNLNWVLYVGALSLLGHLFTPWLHFKGGKGIATGFGVTTAVFRWYILFPLGIFLLLFLTTRIVSISSLTASISLLALMFFLPEFRQQPVAMALVFGMVALIFYRHQENIQRILKGEEKRI